MKKILTLFYTFFKIGMFTFGGGYAMIALLKNEFTVRKQWLTEDEFLDMVSIAESTPGPVSINSATYIGLRTAGVPGALTATTAVCIPSILSIYLISLYFDRFLSITYIQYALDGIQACVIYLIFSASFSMLKGIVKDRFYIIILAAVSIGILACSLMAVPVSMALCILACGMAGVLKYILFEKEASEK